MSDGGIVDGGFRLNNTDPPDTTRVMPLFSLLGKTAIVTGAGAGTGTCIAEALAEAGANVAIWYNTNEDALDRAAQIGKTYGVQCRAYRVNILQSKEITAAVDKIVDEFNGRLDIFVANSGIAWTEGPALDAAPEEYCRLIDTNLNGTYFCALAAAVHFRRQKVEGTDRKGNKLEGYRGGSFVATASMSAHIVNIPNVQAAYNTAKAGVVHLCKSLAVEWVTFARVNSVSPGYIAPDTVGKSADKQPNHRLDKIPMGREGLPGELKGVYLFLASEASSYVTGTDVIVDGGYVLP